MVVHGRNERLSLIRRAAKQGQQYDQFAVTDSELMAHCGAMVLMATPPAKELMRTYLRAEKARTSFTVDTKSAAYQELERLCLTKLPKDLKTPPQLSTLDNGRAKTRLGKQILSKLTDAGLEIGITVKFILNGVTLSGKIQSLDEAKGCFNIYPNEKTSHKIPACDVLTYTGTPIIAKEAWHEMFRHVK